MTVRHLHCLDPQPAGWLYLGARVSTLEPGDGIDVHEPDLETAVVLVRGEISLDAENVHHRMSRPSPFTAMSDVVYVPPGITVTIRASRASEVAFGTAPATGRHPLRVITPDEMASELRGGGPAYRQVTSPLAQPIPAERLIVYEAYVPRGAWSGWPPHRHDGHDGSPYLEETYYFRFDRPSGFGIHRNYTADGHYDEHVIVRDASLVPVPLGYHVCAAAPAANMWILNFLAGAPEHRAVPPVFDQNETWIGADWERGRMTLPAVTPT